MSAVHDGPGKRRVVYTAKTRAVGGRENGFARSSDGRLDIVFSTPGSARIGTNPEQLFAAGWSACFVSAIADAARKRRIALPANTAVDAEVDLVLSDDGYHLSARLNISLPGIDNDTGKILIEEAGQICAYSKGVRNNVDVTIRFAKIMTDEP